MQLLGYRGYARTVVLGGSQTPEEHVSESGWIQQKIFFWLTWSTRSSLLSMMCTRFKTWPQVHGHSICRRLIATFMPARSSIYFLLLEKEQSWKTHLSSLTELLSLWKHNGKGIGSSIKICLGEGSMGMVSGGLSKGVHSTLGLSAWSQAYTNTVSK